MAEVAVRKKLMIVEEIYHEGGPAPTHALRRSAALAVIHNPFAGRYVEDIAGFMEDLKPLGLEMAESLIAALGEIVKLWRALARGQLSDRRANSSMALCGMFLADMQCANSWATPRR